MLIPLEYFIHFSLICNLSLLYLVHHLISHCVILQQNELIMLKIFLFKVTVKFYLGFLSTYCLLLFISLLSLERKHIRDVVEFASTNSCTGVVLLYHHCTG